MYKYSQSNLMFLQDYVLMLIFYLLKVAGHEVNFFRRSIRSDFRLELTNSSTSPYCPQVKPRFCFPTPSRARAKGEVQGAETPC